MPKVDLENVLRRAYAAKFARLPEHPQRTADCPNPSAYIRYARTGWPEELAAHAGACMYCQKSKAAVWSAECPGWRELQDYLQNPNYPDRVAVERHLQWAGCDACAARLELLKQPVSSSVMTRGWTTLLQDTSTGTATGAGNVRPPINVTVEEDNGSIVVQLTTTDPALGGKVLDFRVAGERFETRCELVFERVSQTEWRAMTTVASTEERLLDLSGKRLISFRVREDLDRVHPELQHLDIPQEIRNAARLLAKTASEFYETLIGFSAVPSAVPAAAGSLVLSVELDRYRGGTVSLDLDSSGHGVLRAWFDYPDRITVSLLDATKGTLVPLKTEDATDLRRLSIPAGNSLRHVEVSCPHQVFRALRIIVQKGESET